MVQGKLLSQKQIENKTLKKENEKKESNSEKR